MTEMTSDSAPVRRGGAWAPRLLALVPIVLLVAVAAAFVSSGNSLTSLVGANPPPADELDVRRVEFQPGEIRVLVRNPQPEDITIASVTVDDAIVPFTSTGRRPSAACARPRSRSRSTGSRTTPTPSA